MCLMKLPTIKLFDFAGKNSIIFFGFHIAILRFIENLSYTAPFADQFSILTALVVFVLLVPVALFVNRFCPFIVAKRRAKG